MAKCLVGAVGGLPAADKAKLLPENIRKGVTIAKVTGTLDANCAVCIGALSGGTAKMQYVLYNSAFVSLSGGTVTVKKAGQYKVYAYGMTLMDGTITYSNRRLRITKSGSATTVNFTNVDAKHGHVKWEGSLNVGDTIYAEWESNIKNGFGFPALAVAIAMI